MRRIILLLLLSTLVSAQIGYEHKMGENVYVQVTKSHRLNPVMPVSLEVVQEDGPVADPGIVKCDVYARAVEGGFITVFKCRNGATFRLTKVWFLSNQ